MAREIVKKIPVRFIMKNAPYNIGEIAGFPAAISKRFVDRKRAVYYVPPADDEPEAPAPAPGEDKVIVPEAAITPKHLGGPYYDVAGQKIKGKKKAEDLADELSKRTSGEPPTVKK